MKAAKKFLSIICIITLIVPLSSAFTLEAAAKEESTTREVSSYSKAKTIELTGTEGKNEEEVAALKKIWEENQDRLPYEPVFRDLNDDFYSWDNNGRLTNFGTIDDEDCYYEGPSFKGKISFRAFPMLKTLRVYGYITDLDVSSNTNLTELHCYKNKLTRLDLGNNTNLTHLCCYNNKLTSLDISNNTDLTYLECYDNKLTSLDLSNNTNLAELNCSYNDLTSLDVSHNTKLERLVCYGNKLTTLDVRKCKELKYVFADSNVNIIRKSSDNNDSNDSNLRLTGTKSKNKSEVAALKKIFKKIDWNGAEEDFSANLNNKKYFMWDKNGRLTSLYLPSSYDSNTLSLSAFPELSTFSCTYSGLTSLDVSKNKKLIELDCEGNMLTELDLGNNKMLKKLYCANNRLKKLNISSKANLTEFDCSVNRLTNLELRSSTDLKELSCNWNKLIKLDLTSNTKLIEIDCHNNKLTKLNLRKCTKLVRLSCENNKLKKLDVSKNKELKQIESDFERINTVDAAE